MIYLGTPSGTSVKKAMVDGQLGQLVTPRAGDTVVATTWALDNGCFSSSWDERRWRSGLDKYRTVPGCLFAVVPDVVGDASATDRLWAKWVDIVASCGYLPAYVLQDGCRAIPSDAGAVFTGGSNEWKLGRPARLLIEQAKARGLWAHMGRVNSRRRVQYARACHYDSVDGTFLAFAPDKNLPAVLGWMREANDQLTLL